MYLPGGETIEAVKKDAYDVLNSYIETLNEQNQKIPDILSKKVEEENKKLRGLMNLKRKKLLS